MRFILKNFRKDESGATLVEYGVALILAIVVGGTALSVLAGDVKEQMDVTCTNSLTKSGVITCGT